MNRNLDGAFFRVKRDGSWDNVCFSDLTEDEMNEQLQNRDVEWLKSMCKILGTTIRGLGDQLDLVSE